MDKKEKNKLKQALDAYFREIHAIYVEGDFREESFYPSLKKLIEECSRLFSLKKGVGVLVQPKKTEAGIPDFLIRTNGEIIGYIEAKPPDENLDDIEDSEQLKRYRASLPNLILTNFLEFRLYKNSSCVDKIEVGRKFTLQSLKQPPTSEKLDEFYDLLDTFLSFSIPEIKTSVGLSIELAKRTRFLEGILQEELSRDHEEVSRFYKAFQQELIGSLTEERFADLYAQTITYGLFAARMRVQNGFKKEVAWQAIPESLPLLKEIFYSFTGPHFPESLSWLVDDISQVLEKADIKAILKEFETTRWEKDPVIHFYETFLATYNPTERERLGVYYTPLPVVSYIVRSIHWILKEKFGKSEGLATRDVTLLDPAAGTLTFVVQAIKQVQKELEERGQGGLIKSYIEEHILPHFHAFEILVAPYTVGHFKASMILEEMGYTFREGKRFQFYLTNTLEMKEPKQTSFLIDLAKEGQEAKRIKKEVPILVVLGNPPYSVSSENKSDFIEELMDNYKEDVRDERNIQPLSDDYIKFLRFAHWKLDQAGKGVLGFITNNSYLSGVIHRGMRKKLFETFDEIYVLNLHGSSRIGEKTPEGGKDENVFDIQQGVTIVLYVKLKQPPHNKKVYYADVWGLREKDKYPYLFANDVKTTTWQQLNPVTPYYFFVPKDFALQAQYDRFWKVTDIFREWSSGVKTNRDQLLIDLDLPILKRRITTLVENKLDDELIKNTYGLKDGKYWNTKREREKIRQNKNWQNQFFPYSYRPFDLRWIFYQPNLIEIGRGGASKKLMHHFSQNNLGLTLTRQLSTGKFFHCLITTQITDMCLISIKTKETSYIFPLYLYHDESQGRLFSEGDVGMDRVTNFTPEFLIAVKKSLGKEPATEEVFYYIYAVLYSPTYRTQYEEFLKIDFPRIPLPAEYKSFSELSRLGKELVDLHLMQHSALKKTKVGFPQSGSNKVDKIQYDEDTKRVYFNKEQFFDGIQQEVWEYQIGAYQVMEKYLKDRKGRKLSLDEIDHYMKIAKAISLTIEIQKKIDQVYAS